MSQTKVYLCPSCQSVIRSDRDVSEGLKCDSCGFSLGGGTTKPKRPRPKSAADPVNKRNVGGGSILRDVMKQRGGGKPSAPFSSIEKVGNTKSKESESSAPGEGRRDEESILPDGSRQVKRRKKRRKQEKHRKLYIFITAWIGVIVALLFIFQINVDDEKKKETGSGGPGGLEPWKREFYRSHLESISKNYNSFIQAPSLPAKQQSIDRSSEMAAKFSRFSQTHSSPSFKGKMRLRGQHILELQEDPLVLAVETLWQDYEGKRSEAVHVWDGRGWRLDWECYAPYSSVPWTLFRSGVGKQEGDFRLLVRRRQAGDASKKLTLLFYAPAYAGEKSSEAIRATESPEIVVNRGSEIGDRMFEILSDLEEGKRPMESILGIDDLSGMARVFVNLAWEEDETGESQMVLKKINGVSWYGKRIQKVFSNQDSIEAETKSDLNDSVLEPTVTGE
jgi:hypothetical protein